MSKIWGRRSRWVLFGLGVCGLGVWLLFASLPWILEGLLLVPLRKQVDPGAELELSAVHSGATAFERLALGDGEGGWRLEAGPGRVTYGLGDLLFKRRAEALEVEEVSLRVFGTNGWGGAVEGDAGRGAFAVGSGLPAALPLDSLEVRQLVLSLTRGEGTVDLTGVLNGQATPRGWEQALVFRQEELDLETRFIGHIDLEDATWVATGEMSAGALEEGVGRLSFLMPDEWKAYSSWLPEKLRLEAQLRGSGSNIDHVSGLFSAGPGRVETGDLILDWEGLAGGGILEGEGLSRGAFRFHALLNAVQFGEQLETAAMAVELVRTREEKLRARAGPFELRWPGGGVVGQLELEAPWEAIIERDGVVHSPLHWSLESETAEISRAVLKGMEGRGTIALREPGTGLGKLRQDLARGRFGDGLRWMETHLSGSLEIELSAIRKEGVFEAEKLDLGIELEREDPEWRWRISTALGIAGDFFIEGFRGSGSLDAGGDADWGGLNGFLEGGQAGIGSALTALSDLPAGRAEVVFDALSRPGSWGLETAVLEGEWFGGDTPIEVRWGVEQFEYQGSTLSRIQCSGELGVEAGSIEVGAALPGTSRAALSFKYEKGSSGDGWAWSAALPFTVFEDSAVVGLLNPTLKESRIGGGLSARFEGDFLDLDNWEGKGRLTLKEGCLRDPDLKLEVTGVNGRIRFNGIRPLATEPGQRIRVSRLEAGGLVASRIDCRFQLRDDGAIVVSAIAAELFGGRIRADAFSYQPERPDIQMTLHLEGVELAELQKQIEDFPGTMKGVINGVLRLSWNGRDIGVGRGYLELVPGTTGQLQLNLDGRAASADSPAYDFVKNIAQTQTAVETLRRVEVREARFDLFNEDNPESPNQLVLRGISRSIQPATPVDLTVNLREDVEKVLARALKLFLTQQ